MRHLTSFAMLLVVIVIGASHVWAHSSRDFPQINVSIHDKVLTLDYANTPELRDHGLQHRRVLCDDCGMLFEYEQNQIAALSTKDTFLPLDIAFVEENGNIIQIIQMRPFDENEQLSKKPVRYAIEVSRGWFNRQKIKVGDKVIVALPQT
jgi:uncharacterized membrane protein (UPF0127 family)